MAMKLKKNSAYKSQYLQDNKTLENYNLEDFDDDKSSETASSKDPKHSEFASIDDASSYLASHRFHKDSSNNDDSVVDKMLMEENISNTNCNEELNLNLLVNQGGNN